MSFPPKTLSVSPVSRNTESPSIGFVGSVSQLRMRGISGSPGKVSPSVSETTQLLCLSLKNPDPVVTKKNNNRVERLVDSYEKLVSLQQQQLCYVTLSLHHSPFWFLRSLR